MTHFAQPIWLAIAVILAGLQFWLYRRFDRRQATQLRRFSVPRLTDDHSRAVSRSRLWLKRSLLISGIVCLCVALARPLGGLQLQQTHRQGVDILLAIDTSRSMLTPDVKPDRLARAKLTIEDLLDKLHGDAVGLIAFAGDAFLQTPVTTDYEAFRESLEAIDTQTIPRGGTDIGAAIRLAQATIGASSASDKILVLVTDGEDLGGDAIDAAKAAAQHGIRIFTVGVGTSAGELIPVPDGHGGTAFIKDPAGQFVKSRLDEATLRQIAQLSGGAYQPLGPQGQGLASLYTNDLSRFERHDLGERAIAVYSELFEWPLLLGFALLVVEWLVRLRAAHPTEAAAPLRTAAPDGVWRTSPGLPSVLLFGLAVTAAPVVSHASVRSAEKAYQQGNYARATQDYQASVEQDPSQSTLQFNLGAAAYKLGDYHRAIAAFNLALKAKQVSLQQNTYYNLGNALYRSGEHTAKSDVPSTAKAWQTALDNYTTALELRPGDADAKFNRDFVKHKLEELQRQQKSAPQQQPAPSQSRQSQRGGQSQHGQSPQPGQQIQQGQRARQGQPSQPSQSGAASTGSSTASSQSQATAPKSIPKSGNSSAARSGQPQQPPAVARQQPAQRSGPGGSPTPVDARSMPTGNASTTEAEQSQPGQMSRAEAEQLLDSLKGESRHLAMAAPGVARPDAGQLPVKDW